MKYYQEQSTPSDFIPIILEERGRKIVAFKDNEIRIKKDGRTMLLIEYTKNDPFSFFDIVTK